MNEKINGSSPKSCRKPKKTEVCLGLSLVIIAIFCIYQFVDLSLIYEFAKCNGECVNSANEIKEFANMNIDPCVDFHEFACGNFFKTAYTHQIKSPLLHETDLLNNELRGFIVGPVGEDDAVAVKLQKKFFHSCFYPSENGSVYDQIFLDLLEEIGGWPALKGAKWQENQFNWMEAMVQCQELGLPFQWFLTFGTYVFGDNHTNYLKISYPNISKHSKKLMTDVVQKFLGNTANADNEMLAVVDFETKLANLTNKNYTEIEIVKIEELEELRRKFQWDEFLNNLTGGIHNFTDDFKIATNIKNYILDLDNLLIKTSKRTQANYIIWKILEEFVPFLSKSTRAIFDYHMRKLPDTIEARFEFCINATKTKLPLVSETEYIRKYATREARKSAKIIVDTIRNEFIMRVKTSKLMDEETIKMHLKKLETMTIVIGGQDEIFNEEFFDDNVLHLRGSNFSSDNIILIMTERSRIYYNSLFRSIGTPGIDEETIAQYPLNIEMQVHYDEEKNRLVVPSPLLHGLIHNHQRYKYLNFAGLGTLVSKALTRSLEMYHKISIVAEVPVNSTEFFDGIFTDIIGRNVAYSAYQNWVQSNKHEPKLQDLNYTANQLFWIKSGLPNCYKTIEIIEDSNQEQLSKYSNILPVKHSHNFAEDFKCPAGSPMNPPAKYIIIL